MIQLFNSSHLLNKNGLVVTQLRSALPDVMAIYAFGSRIQGVARASSDLDLAVLTPGYTDPLLLWQLSGDLAEQVQCDIDLLDLRAASTVMQYQIIITGRLLWGDKLAVGLFECFVLSEKTALNTARADLLADIVKKGKIYGG
ncbi:type VII toxin-antitoxin system MntA family adenylyltransferase antitoxin [Crenothrix polyspora]|nr:nucleotidyltransferase domain-containing protein [Crenothrix polyspora]